MRSFFGRLRYRSEIPGLIVGIDENEEACAIRGGACIGDGKILLLYSRLFNQTDVGVNCRFVAESKCVGRPAQRNEAGGVSTREHGFRKR